MTAEWIDPFAPVDQPLLTMEEFEAINAEVLSDLWLDPTRHSECLQLAMEALRVIGCAMSPAPAEVTATQALRRIVQRSVSGVPFIERYEPADSFDPPPAPRVEDRTPKPGWMGHRDLCPIQWSESCDCDPGSEG